MMDEDRDISSCVGVGGGGERSRPLSALSWCRTVAGLAGCVVSGVLLAGLGVQLFGRMWYFFVHYHAEPGQSHVADGYFTVAYLVSGAGTLIGLMAMLAFRTTLSRLAAGLLAGLNLAAGVTFAIMHHTGMLVTYGEFITIYGP